MVFLAMYRRSGTMGMFPISSLNCKPPGEALYSMKVIRASPFESSVRDSRTAQPFSGGLISGCLKELFELCVGNRNRGNRKSIKRDSMNRSLTNSRVGTPTKVAHHEISTGDGNAYIF